MAETKVQLKNQDEVRALFGPRDDYLRRLRQSTNTRVVLRGNAVHIDGEEPDVDRCEEVLRSWQSIFRNRSELLDSDVTRSLSDDQEQEIMADFSQPTSEVFDLSSVSTEPRSRDIRASRSGKDRVASIRPKTEGQKKYMDAMADNSLVFCDGPAGCGKTFLAVAAALQALREEEVRKIVLVRPAVEAGEKLGFLPGDMFAKVNPFIRPLLDSMNDMLDFEQVRRLMANDVIEIAPLAFMRGRTLNDTFMILDEGQNTTITQMKMFLTRMGINSKIVVTGDATQNDLPKGVRSGLVDGIRRLSGIAGVAIVRLTGHDIVRHRLVREIVSAYEADGSDVKHE
ncbi:MAG: PhoH family protein [Planctomycetaceae bacterium]|nr:PhoH family protein [Planctomycetaceae bacterium]